GITLFDKDQKLSIQLVQGRNKSLPTIIFEVLKRIYEQDVNSKIDVESDSKKFLMVTILEFVSAQNNNTVFKQDINQEIENFIFSNSSQHKDKRHSANRRYLLAIENQNNKVVWSNNQDKISKSEPKKKNKC
ncbi:20723_t:CDS:2, partial [Racocetra persica]